MKNVFLSAAVIAAVLIGCPETPEAGTEGGSGSGTEAGAVPVDPASVELTNVSIGQDNGSIVVSWRDPAVDDLKSISIITRHGETGAIVDDGSVEPGPEKYTVAKEKLEVGETYILTLFGETGDGKKTAETKIPRTLSTVSLMFTQKEVYDTYAEFEWATSSADEDLVFEYGEEQKEIPAGGTSLKISGLNPGTDYTFTLRTQSGDARIDWQAETMLFWDDFDYSTPEDLTASRWIWAERANSSNTGHWSFSMRGEDNKNRVELLDEDGSRFLRLKGEYQGTSADTEKMLGSGLRSQGRFYFTFGKVEIRFRFKDSLPGSFPALWMMPQSADPGCSGGGGWPFGGEIDIMERVHSKAALVYNTAHTENWSTEGNGYAGKSKQYNVRGEEGGSGSAEDWNTWNTVGIEWTKSGLQWYVNGKKTHWIPSEDNLRNYPFTEKSSFYLIMNMSVARGGFPGNAEPGFYNHMDVDYVKVTPNADTIVQDCPYYTPGGVQ